MSAISRLLLHANNCVTHWRHCNGTIHNHLVGNWSSSCLLSAVTWIFWTTVSCLYLCLQFSILKVIFDKKNFSPYGYSVLMSLWLNTHYIDVLRAYTLNKDTFWRKVVFKLTIRVSALSLRKHCSFRIIFCARIVNCNTWKNRRVNYLTHLRYYLRHFDIRLLIRSNLLIITYKYSIVRLLKKQGIVITYTNKITYYWYL